MRLVCVRVRFVRNFGGVIRVCDNTGLASSLPDDSLSVGQHSVTEAHVNTPLLHYNIRSHQAVYTLLPPARRVSMCTAATSRPRSVLFQR